MTDTEREEAIRMFKEMFEDMEPTENDLLLNMIFLRACRGGASAPPEKS